MHDLSVGQNSKYPSGGMGTTPLWQSFEKVCWRFTGYFGGFGTSPFASHVLSVGIASASSHTSSPGSSAQSE